MVFGHLQVSTLEILKKMFDRYGIIRIMIVLDPVQNINETEYSYLKLYQLRFSSKTLGDLPQDFCRS